MAKSDLTHEQGMETIKAGGRKIRDTKGLVASVKVAHEHTVTEVRKAVQHGATGQDILEMLEAIDPAKVAANLQANP